MDPYSPPETELKPGSRAKRGWGLLAILYVLSVLVSLAFGPRLPLQGPPLSLIPFSAPLAILLLSASALRDGFRERKLLQGALVALVSPLTLGVAGLVYYLRREVSTEA